MPAFAMPSLFRWIVAGGVCLGAAGFAATSHAQGYPQGYPAQSTNPVCPRLEAQLAAIDRGGGDPAHAQQVRRYEDAAARQQQELERVTAQARRMGCDSSGFFSLFNGQSAQCGPVNTRIQQMRANLDQITNNLERLRGGADGGFQHSSQRRSVLMALAQNNCGPQYANAVRNSGPGGFFENLFGGGQNGADVTIPPPESGAPSGTYRTVCVRTCDGYYFPISFATVPSRFADDERTCRNQCPAQQATLFTYRNPGEDINQAVSISGQPYSSLPNAFKYRKEYIPSCSCKPAGETWAEALKNIDDRSSIHQGDIIVTEDRAKKMSQPKQTSKPAKNAPQNNAPKTNAESNGKIRNVGPKFLQGN